MDALKNLVARVLSGLQSPANTPRQKIWNEWASIAGPKIAPHTKPSLSQSGQLFVWVEQPSLAFEINQKHKAGILKRAQACAGEKNVINVKVCVGQLR